jgi:hypothetical protein
MEILILIFDVQGMQLQAQEEHKTSRLQNESSQPTK